MEEKKKDIHWYPGHMTKAIRQMQEDIKLIDVVVEIVDARIPMSSKNPDLDTLAKGKSRILLLNKADLADEDQTEAWKTWYEGKGFLVAAINAKNGNGVRKIRDLVAEAAKEKRERDRKRGILNRPVRCMVAGIPNVGKSTFINSFAGRAVTKTGNTPGVTRGKQWIRLNKEVELLDTPGILWPKFESQTVAERIAFIGSIRDEVVNQRDLGIRFVNWIEGAYPGKLAAYYGIPQAEEAIALLSAIAEKRAALKKGGEPDFDRAAQMVLDDVKNGRLGRMTFDTVAEMTDGSEEA